MRDRGFNIKSWAAAAALAAGNVLCSAQPAPGGTLFSKPSDGGITSPDSNDHVPVDNSAERPMSGFGAETPSALPAPTPDLSPAAQMKLNERAKWTLMTPEEIMGIQTPEEIFGLTTEDQDRNISPEERYLKREEKAKAETANASLQNAESASHDYTGLFERADNLNPGLAAQEQAEPGAFSRMFGNAEASPFGHNSGISAGAKALSANAAEIAKANREQAAEMDRFRILIGEVPQSPSPALTAPHLDGTPEPQPLSAFDEFGRPAATRSIDLSKPDGLSLPAEIIGYAAPPRKLKKPSWEAQTPPWLSGGGNPSAAPPVRKFY